MVVWQVSIPFLLLHGDADTVTDPAVSKTLYEKSISKDKTFNLYPDMWHSMIHGAFKHNAEKVLQVRGGSVHFSPVLKFDGESEWSSCTRSNIICIALYELQWCIVDHACL